MIQGPLRGETNNLPAEMTSFVGRRREIAEVKRLLSSARLVTLTGGGGIGKTRLALAVSRKLQRALADGVWLVELATLTTPELVDQTMMQALGIGGLPTRRNIDVLAEFLQDKQALLVLDNCEHLLTECAAVAGQLLRACPSLRILATSREPLRITGEHTFTVPPLTVPNPAVPVPVESGCEAVALFVERAKETAPHFALTDGNRQILARVCSRLDGVPLAIELATARVRTLALDQILDLLDNQQELLASSDGNGSPRHQTIRTAMDWSFQLCTPEERLLWARLSIFASGFDVAAAESVCAGRGLDRDRILPLITALIDKSILVRQDHPHAQFRLLETVRQYGRERLTSSGEETELRHRHRDYYRDVVEQTAAQWYGPDQYALSARIRDALPNIRAALDTCLTEPGTARMGLQIAGALWFYWTACEYPREGRRWLERALMLEPQPCREHARALWAFGYLAVRLGEFELALSILDQCRVLCEQLGDQELRAATAVAAGMAELLRNNVSGAVPILHRAVDWHLASGARTVLVPTALALLGLCAILEGELDRAVSSCHRARRLSQQHGERWALAFTLWNLGLAHLLRGELAQARAAALEALTIRSEMNDVFGIALGLELIAWIAAAGSEAERAARLIGGCGRLWQPVGTPLYGSESYQGFHDDCVRRARHELGDRGYCQAVHSGRNLGTGELVTYACAGADADHTVSSTVTCCLTEREQEIADLVSEGLSNRQIADRLLICLRTAEGHVQNILTKLGFTSRVQIATWAARWHEVARADS
jgi:predicted ATPase/DNA-binding CsgD family transcriptional regulator